MKIKKIIFAAALAVSGLLMVGCGNQKVYAVSIVNEHKVETINLSESPFANVKTDESEVSTLEYSPSEGLVYEEDTIEETVEKIHTGKIKKDAGVSETPVEIVIEPATEPAAETKTEIPVEKTLSADEVKFNKVYESMSARFKGDIKKEDINIQEFVSDLEYVLGQDEIISGDDVSLLYLIDKKHSIGSEKNPYVPKNLVKLVKNNDYIINKNNLSLRPVVAEALKEMAQAAKKDGVTLDVSSTYRSYEYQKALFQHWVDVDGLKEAERESARAGTSQHQLGVAIDFGSISADYDRTPGGKWMYKNASDYGWSLSFPKNYEDVTGFKWECWHFRYIGVDACNLQKKYFNNVQQFMIEFIDAWKNAE